MLEGEGILILEVDCSAVGIKHSFNGFLLWNEIVKVVVCILLSFFLSNNPVR